MRKLFVTLGHVRPILLMGVGITPVCYEVYVYWDGYVRDLVLYFVRVLVLVRGFCRDHDRVRD
jgi:hypothetical protein